MPIDYQQYPVLFVDDEPQNLVVFRYALEEHFTILTASSGQEALNLMHGNRFAVILSDQRMPEMTGVELCARARELQPDAVRILVTAYADVYAAIDAINLGQVSRYLVKPWRNEELIEVIQTAIEFVQMQEAMRDMQLRLLQGGQSRIANAVQERVLHEISQPLQAMVITNTETTKKLDTLLSHLQTDRNSEVLKHEVLALKELHDATIAATGQLVSLAARARTGSISPSTEHCDAGAAIESTLRIIRREVERTAQLDISILRSSHVALDAAGLGQIVLNLVLNAAEAMRDSGAAGRSIKVIVDRTDEVGLLQVRDNGPGIQPEHLPHIFRPHFTTKASGSGLGLSIVSDMIKRAGGKISVHSVAGHETIFEVQLPLSAPMP